MVIMVSKVFYIFCLFILFDEVFCEHGQDPVVVVDTSVGQIQGKINDYSTMFLGVPYGLVDEKKLFGDATPHPRFNTPYEAFNDTAICPQIVKGTATGTIHCLHLNIYTPNHDKHSGSLPVMMFLHGGAFVEGNGGFTSYSPKFLIKHDVILVTVNYRLGPYGYLCFPHSEYSNQALKDQQLALKWIKDNIKSFGGDSDNILLFGHSSGSVSVDMLLLYANKQLFNKVILQSGVSTIPYLSEASSSLFISTIAKGIGFNVNTDIDVEEFVHRMSNITTDELIQISKDLVFRPCIDEILITKTPKLNDLKNMKMMIGAAAKEILFLHANVAENFYENYNFVTELEKGFYKVPDEAVDVIESFYSDNNYKDDIVDFGSDFAFHSPIERSARNYLERNATVYRYLFSYDGGRNFVKIRDKITTAGAAHGDELGYLYDMPLFGNITKEDQLLVDRISLMWTNFAKYGDPTPKETPLLPVKWLPSSKANKHYLEINSNLELRKGPFLKNMAFWNLFYYKYGKYARGVSLGEKWTKPDCDLNK